MRKPEEIRTAFAPRESLEGKREFFLVGIGGAGMSALARMLHTRGFRVRGTDSTPSSEVDRLRAEGIEVTLGHTGEPLAKSGAETALVLSDAIDLSKSPEVMEARRNGIEIFRRSQALGWLLKPYKVIAVTGTHGKTTTTGMTGSALIAAGLDPLVVVGAGIPEWEGPVREGKGEWAVVEACEAYDAFHDFDPTIVVLTNLELDHIDYHGTWENLRDSVLRFSSRIPEDGALVYCSEDAGACEIANKVGRALIPYNRSTFPSFSTLPLNSPGDHNVLNAGAAALAVQAAGGDVGMASPGIAAFRGAERRLQILRDSDDSSVTVIDDYAHHPTEIAASLQAVRSRFPSKRLVVVYQPHLYSRTAPLIEAFAEALSHADEIVLTDIYPAREDPIPGVSSARIAERVTRPVRYIPSRHLLPRELARTSHPGDVVVGMGAGNISQFGPALVRELDRLGGSRPRRVAVVYGGDSAEREVSLLSGREVQSALVRRGHEAYLVDMTDLILGSGDLSRFVGIDRPDVAFLAVHGTHAEDGAIQGLFELLHIPYTGSGIQASAMAMDKAMTKRVLASAGIKVPVGVHLTRHDQRHEVRPPLIVKPNAQGSTVGLRFVEDPEEVEQAVANAFRYDSEVLVEEWITGVEISVPVLEGIALPPVEIAPASGRYDFESKYTPGATEEIIPARLPKHILDRVGEIAVQAHEALGCAGATRTDMIVRGEEVFVLEVNTLPGMTRTSLLPNSASSAGISFEELCERIMEDALRRDAARS